MEYYISKIYLKNFKCIGNENGIIIDFKINNGLIALSGPNGFGKTTIFDAIQISFCDDIDRIICINTKSKNIKDNIYIYKNRELAIVGLELRNKEDKNVITLVKIIRKSASNNENNRKESIESYYSNESINIDKINKEVYGEKIDNLSEFLEKKLGLNNNYYNSFYYISQDNEANCLKQGLSYRKDIFNALMKIETQVNVENRISDILNEKKPMNIKEEIKNRKLELKNKIKSLNFKEKEKIEHEDYIMVFNEDDGVEWDGIEFSIKDSEPVTEIENIVNLIKNYEVFKIRNNNKLVSKYSNEDILNKIIDIVKYTDYDNMISLEKNISKKVEDLRTYKKIFDAKEKIKKYEFDKEEMDQTIIYLNNQLKLELGIEKIKKQIKNVVLENERLSNNKNNLKKLKENIIELNTIFLKSTKEEEQNICPVCKTNFSNSQELQFKIKKNIEELENQISFKNKDDEENLKKVFKNIIEKSEEYLKENKINIDVNDIDNVIEKLLQYNTKQNIKDVIKWFIDNKILKKIVSKCKKNQIDELKMIIQEKIVEEPQEYTEEQYMNDMKIYEKYKNKLEFNSEFLDKLNKKMRYFKYKLYELDCKTNIEINKDLKTLFKLTKLQCKLERIKKEYTAIVKNFKKQIIKNIEIPLYIYTGKIIQTYQGGLGVFIKEDKNTNNIVFTPNPNETEHDIVNTFSSGQLAAFSIAFLLVVNQLYIIKQKDKCILKTILIDDPVQTMDDVNIASLVEVLRNQFSNYQIIMSTHESDKVNYIRYKFEKFGIKTMEYNVKKNFFSNIKL
ncbi:AAA family ATPase [Clostridium cochlearium]|uniref:AAA family ATPase n=1 Tax=Clostridium cochlearium TaxID=1494 RepID=UPI00214A8220|nr:AAA family ATPase [Clostridium cochlearium]MCR1971912.1 AAA family ATPase [Clostridium cochlearium]